MSEEVSGILSLVHQILEYGDICDHCLGRLFAKRSFGLTNVERGHALRVAHALAYNIPFKEYEEGTCWVCNDLFLQIPYWAEKAAEAAEGIEYETFVIGTRVPPMTTLGLTSARACMMILGLGRRERKCT